MSNPAIPILPFDYAQGKFVHKFRTRGFASSDHSEFAWY